MENKTGLNIKKLDWQTLMPWLELMEPYRSNCLFVAGGDIVGDAVATAEAYEEVVRYFGHWPAAYVAQNGSEDMPLPDTCSAVFIAGSEGWKTSDGAKCVISRAVAAGLHVHVGRVNWGKRFRAFQVLKGSENFTCDGARPKYDGVKRTRKDWAAYESQPPLIQL